VLALLNNDDQVALRYHYDAFGVATDAEKFDLNYPGPDNLFGYTELGYDASSGLSYARARYFDSSIGRFISQDTYEGQLDNPLSLNLYTYVENNPLRYVDPTGNAPKHTGTWYTNQKIVKHCAQVGMGTCFKEAMDGVIFASSEVVDFLFLDDINTILDPNASAFAGN